MTVMHALLKQQENWSMQSLLGGSDSEDDYREALELVEYLIEEDAIHLSTFWRAIAEYETTTKSLVSSQTVAAMPVGVAFSHAD